MKGAQLSRWRSTTRYPSQQPFFSLQNRKVTGTHLLLWRFSGLNELQMQSVLTPGGRPVVLSSLLTVAL